MRFRICRSSSSGRSRVPGDAPVQILGQPKIRLRHRRRRRREAEDVAAAGQHGDHSGRRVRLRRRIRRLLDADPAGLFSGQRRAGCEGLAAALPARLAPRHGTNLDSPRPILFRYFAGIAAVIVYAGCAAYLGLGLFLGLRHAAFLAALTGLLEVLPVVGPALSAVIAGLVAVQEAKSIWSIVAYMIYASALRLSVDQLVGPFVLGNAARVHPTLVIFCFLAGGALFGMVGVILAVPFALMVKVTLATIYGEPIDGRQSRPTARRYGLPSQRD